MLLGTPFFPEHWIARNGSVETLAPEPELARRVAPCGGPIWEASASSGSADFLEECELSGQQYPDGEFAKAAVSLAQYIQSNFKDKRCADHAEFLTLVATCVRALQGVAPDKLPKATAHAPAHPEPSVIPLAPS